MEYRRRSSPAGLALPPLDDETRQGLRWPFAAPARSLARSGFSLSPPSRFSPGRGPWFFPPGGGEIKAAAAAAAAPRDLSERPFLQRETVQLGTGERTGEEREAEAGGGGGGGGET